MRTLLVTVFALLAVLTPQPSTRPAGAAADVAAAFRAPDGRPIAGGEVRWYEDRPDGLAWVKTTVTDEDGRAEPPTGEVTLGLLTPDASRPPLLWRTGRAPEGKRQWSGRSLKVVAVLGGRPVPAAEVVAVPAELLAESGGLWPGPSARTDPTGVVTIPVSSRRDWTLIRAPGHATTVVSREAPVVVLPEALSLSGRLLDHRHRPIPGKLIRASAPVAGDPKPWAWTTQTRSDEVGRFRFDDVPEKVRLLYSDRDGAPGFRERTGPVRQLDLVVPERATLTAAFRDSDGRPIEGVELLVEQFDLTETVLLARSCLSGSDGLARCEKLSSALPRSRVQARAPGGGQDSRVLLDPLGVSRDLGEWRLSPPGEARGTVESPGGRPIRGARLFHLRSARDLAVTDASGAFAVKVMGRVSVIVKADGFLDQTVWVSPGSGARISLRPVTTIRATLTYRNGESPEWAELRRTDGVRSLRPVSGRRSPDAFLFETEAFAADATIFVPGAEEVSLGWISAQQGEVVDRGVIELYDGASMLGRLVDDGTGESLAGSVVTAQPVREGDLLDAGEEARLQTVRTRPDGTFRVSGLPGGVVRLWIEAPGRAVKRVNAFATEEGTDLGSIHVEVGFPVELLLRHPDGTPASRIPVICRPGGFDGVYREQQWESGEDGSVVAPRMASGRYALRARIGNRYARRLVTVSPSDARLEWNIGGATIEGRLTAQGRPFPGVPVTLRYGPPGELSWAADVTTTTDGIPLERRELGERPLTPPVGTDTEGRFRFPDVGEGRATLWVEGTGWGAEGKDVDVPAGGRLAVGYELGPPALRTRLVDGEGTPVSTGQIGVYGLGGRKVAAGRVDDDGRVVFYLSGAGAALYLRGTDGVSRKGVVALAPTGRHEAREIDVVLDRGLGRVAVVVEDDQRRPVPGALVQLVSLVDGKVLAGRTDRDGRLLRSGVFEGGYSVHCRSPEGAFGESRLSVGDTETSTVVVVRPGGSIRLRLEEREDVDPTRVTVRILDRDGEDAARREERLGRVAAFDETGTYQLAGLEPGRYRVEVGTERKRATAVTVDVRAGRTTTRVLSLD